MNDNYSRQEIGHDISLEADLWAQAPYWTFEDFDLLAVGIDPRKLRSIDAATTLDLQEERRRDIRGRLEVILRGRDDRHKLPPKEFLKIAAAASVAMPVELITAVEKVSAADQPSADVKEQSVSRIQYRKLLKMFLAVAVEQYMYDPRKSRQDAVMNIIRDAEKMQIYLDDQTVRDRLREAKDELDAQEDIGLLDYLSRTS